MDLDAVGATWVASKPGGLNIKESLQPREISHTEVAVWIFCDVPSRSRRDEGRCLLGRNGYMHQEDYRGMGASIWGKIRGDNAGKDQLPAGTRNNLQRLIDQE